jgi:hypothetical protein
MKRSKLNYCNSGIRAKLMQIIRTMEGANTLMNFGFHKRLGIPCLAERLLPSEGGSVPWNWLISYGVRVGCRSFGNKTRISLNKKLISLRGKNCKYNYVSNHFAPVYFLSFNL